MRGKGEGWEGKVGRERGRLRWKREGLEGKGKVERERGSLRGKKD